MGQLIEKPDLTIIYYTANRLKPFFAENVRKQLVKAADGIPIISVSHQPMNFGTNICVGTGVYSAMQIYRQILIGAKAAKTKYIAMAEDDTLYSPEHFRTYMPKDDEFAYNFCRWSIYTWVSPPTYSLKYRRVMSTLVAPRALTIEALEERFTKYPTEASLKNLEVFSEFGKYEKILGVTPRKSVDYRSYVPCIVFSHEEALGWNVLGKKKRMGQLRAYDIPVWGRAEDVLKNFYGIDSSPTK